MQEVKIWTTTPIRNLHWPPADNPGHKISLYAKFLALLLQVLCGSATKAGLSDEVWFGAIPLTAEPLKEETSVPRGEKQFKMKTFVCLPS